MTDHTLNFVFHRVSLYVDTKALSDPEILTCELILNSCFNQRYQGKEEQRTKIK